MTAPVAVVIVGYAFVVIRTRLRRPLAYQDWVMVAMACSRSSTSRSSWLERTGTTSTSRSTWSCPCSSTSRSAGSRSARPALPAAARPAVAVVDSRDDTRSRSPSGRARPDRAGAAARRGARGAGPLRRRRRRGARGRARSGTTAGRERLRRDFCDISTMPARAPPAR